jgi:hypothetical protein
MGNLMAAETVHAVIAAGLAEPELLQHWMQDPEQVRKFGIDPAEVDWQGLWLFAGLGTKVRYNPLRAELPLTFRVLKATGLEIGIFSHYALQAAILRHQGKNSFEDKARSLYAFLETWLDLSDKKHALIWDTIRHEMLLASLRNASSNRNSAEKISDLPSLEDSPQLSVNAVPKINGTLELLEMSYDPDRLQELLIVKFSALEQLEKEPCCLGYWLPAGSNEVHLLRLDYFSFHLLQLVDNVRSVDGITQTLGRQGIGLRAEEVLQGLLVLASQQVVSLVEK